MQAAAYNSSAEEIRALLQAAGGDSASASRLFASLYAELHRISERQLRQFQGALTVSPTTLLHEAYLAIAGRDGSLFPDRNRFLAYAGRAMRGLVIDYLRRRRALKNGGQFYFTALDTQIGEITPDPEAQISRLSDSLEDLERDDPALAELVDLRFFCGLSVPEIAALRGISQRTVERDWTKAKLYLRFVLDAADR
jgi:RNA polymerase sigma factor (TIGR02999 family)